MKGILLIPLLIISNFSLFAQYEMECYHHNYLENQKVYAWKYDGVKLHSKPNIASTILSIVPQGYQLLILELIETYSEDFICFSDTVLRDPLIVFRSPFIKVKYGEKIGYVLEHYLNKMKPFNIEKLIDSGKEIFQEVVEWPGDYSPGQAIRQVFDNGITCYTYFGGKVSYDKSYLIPFISQNNFNLIALQLLGQYGRNKEEGVEFESDEKSFSWFISDPTGEMPSEEVISIQITPLGMVYMRAFTGC